MVHHLLDTKTQCSEWVDLTAWLETHRAELRWLANTTDEPSMFESNGRRSTVFLDVHSPPSGPAPRLAVGYSGEANATTTTTNSLINLCDVHTTHLDLTIICVGSFETGASTCNATRARHSALYPLLGTETLDAVFHHTPFRNIPALLTTSPSSSPSRFAHLLTNLGLPPSSTAYNATASPPLLPHRLLNARLAYFLNTYWRLALPGSASRSKYASTSASTAAPSTPPFYAPAPTATTTVLLVDVYAVRWAWLGLYIAAAGVMLVCAVGAAALRAGVRVPDVFGGVAGAAWESRWVGGEEGERGGSVLDAAERAGRLRARWCRVQDVRPFEEVGRIALSDWRRGLRAGEVRWDRRYE
ncbi:hypothetical protein SLS55_008384 [Diplodia seriata]|uniref:Uncharacterized protein n=1 Tax=Diplodia seriata TaxID=420778 RepID=A0ABR3CAB8_9PEZI